MEAPGGVYERVTFPPKKLPPDATGVTVTTNPPVLTPLTMAGNAPATLYVSVYTLDAASPVTITLGIPAKEDSATLSASGVIPGAKAAVEVVVVDEEEEGE